MQLNVDANNPMRAIQQLLDVTMIQVLSMREAVKLMEFPLHRYKVRKLAEIHMQNLEAQLIRLSNDHLNVCARLKELGY